MCTGAIHPGVDRATFLQAFGGMVRHAGDAPRSSDEPPLEPYVVASRR